MNQMDTQALCNLFLSVVDLKPGQCVHVKFDDVHWPFVVELAREAYDRGARYVHADAQHPALTKARIEASVEEHLLFVPGFRAKVNQDLIDEKWVRISIAGDGDPSLLASLNPHRAGIVQKAVAQVDKPYRHAVQTNVFPWLVTALPTQGWAAKVLGRDPSAEVEDELWRVMRPIMRLDQPDPVAAWRSHDERTASLITRLMALDLNALHFRGPGTDLTVGLPRGAVWIGGWENSQDGTRFLPNLPTAEVFTTPNAQRTNGHVSLTRPVFIDGRIVSGAAFTFRDGQVVEWEADEGKETLTKIFEIDENARYLGEVALVDSTSPIFKSGIVFRNTLLDENAACHIAFGSAYPSGIPGGETMTPDEFRAAGGNVSAVHTDVMIGSPEVEVTGTTTDGETVPVIIDGEWAI